MSPQVLLRKCYGAVQGGTKKGGQGRAGRSEEKLSACRPAKAKPVRTAGCHIKVKRSVLRVVRSDGNVCKVKSASRRPVVWNSPAIHENERTAPAREPRPGESYPPRTNSHLVSSAEVTNVLVRQVKCTTFQHPPEDKVFGAPRPLDPEGAREGTSKAQA